MRSSIRGKALLAGACMLVGAAAWAQQPQAATKETPASFDLAVTYAPERAQLVPGNCGCFWMQGASAEAAVSWRKGFGLVASVFGGQAAAVAPGVDVNKIMFLGGERYTGKLRTWHEGTPQERKLQFFGEWLFGDVHAFNGVFPASGGVKSSADAFAMQMGGGLNMSLYKRLGVRLVQVDYVKTTLPNNATNAQDDLRLATGLTFRIGRH